MIAVLWLQLLAVGTFLHGKGRTAAPLAQDKRKHDDPTAALVFQNQLEQDLKNCQYDTPLIASNFTYSIVVPCSGIPQKCCIEKGNAASFLSKYSCGDKLSYYLLRDCFVQTKCNGTVVISRVEILVPQSPTTNDSLQVSNYNFYWRDLGNLNYQLDYLDGNNFRCPSYIYGLA